MNYISLFSLSDIVKKCSHVIHSDGKGGVIKSPRFPQKYTPKTFCDWTILASKRQNKILIQLETFTVEGKMVESMKGKPITESGEYFFYSPVLPLKVLFWICPCLEHLQMKKLTLFDSIKIYSFGKYCKRRRNCFLQAISPFLTILSMLYGTCFPF